MTAQVLVKGIQLVLNDCLHGWLRAPLGELAGLLQCCSFIFRPHSPRSNFGVSAVNYMCLGGLGR